MKTLQRSMKGTGTCNFESFSAAKEWYRPYNQGLSEIGLEKEIKRKIAEGEIEIGPPNLKPGQFLRTSEGRYQIMEYTD